MNVWVSGRTDEWLFEWMDDWLDVCVWCGLVVVLPSLWRGLNSRKLSLSVVLHVCCLLFC